MNRVSSKPPSSGPAQGRLQRALHPPNQRKGGLSGPAKAMIVAAIITAIAGIMAAIIPAIISNWQRPPIPIPTPVPTISPTPPPSVTIIFPASGDKVDLWIIVRGTASNIPQQGKELWVLVESVGIPGYFPQQGGPIAVSPNSTWSAQARIGTDDPRDRGKKYVIHIVLADQEGIAAIHEYLKQTGQYKPLGSLNGMLPISDVEVVRK